MLWSNFIAQRLQQFSSQRRTTRRCPRCCDTTSHAIRLDCRYTARTLCMFSYATSHSNMLAQGFCATLLPSTRSMSDHVYVSVVLDFDAMVGVPSQGLPRCFLMSHRHHDTWAGPGWVHRPSTMLCAPRRVPDQCLTRCMLVFYMLTRFAGIYLCIAVAIRLRK